MHEEEVGFGGRGGGGGMEVVEEEGLGFRSGGGGMEGSMAAAAERREERETAARRSRNGQGNGRPDGVKPWMGGGGELGGFYVYTIITVALYTNITLIMRLIDVTAFSWISYPFTTLSYVA
jgi:hypothetical protein